MTITSDAPLADSTTITTGERTCPYRWTHRIRGRSIRQTAVGWPRSPNSAACITTTNERLHNSQSTEALSATCDWFSGGTGLFDQRSKFASTRYERLRQMDTAAIDRPREAQQGSNAIPVAARVKSMRHGPGNRRRIGVEPTVLWNRCQPVVRARPV